MRKMIFCINSGRSGSKYLAKLLNTARNATAYHEPFPDMAGRRLSKFPAANKTLTNRLLYIPAYILKYRKVLAIRKALRELPENHHYIETNHMFISSFYDVIMNHFTNVHIIILRRYLPKVLKSFIELDLFGASPHTPYWTTPPDSPSAAVQTPINAEELDQIDRCIAFLVDIEARTQRFIRQYNSTPYIEVRVEELNQREHVQKLFAELDLETSSETKDMIGNIVNSRDAAKEIQKRKKNNTSEVTEEYCLERINLYVEKCKRAGIILPDLPQLNL